VVKVVEKIKSQIFEDVGSILWSPSFALTQAMFIYASAFKILEKLVDG
jgi:hypothetical protein